MRLVLIIGKLTPFFHQLSTHINPVLQFSAPSTMMLTMLLHESQDDGAVVPRRNRGLLSRMASGGHSISPPRLRLKSRSNVASPENDGGGKKMNILGRFGRKTANDVRADRLPFVSCFWFLKLVILIVVCLLTFQRGIRLFNERGSLMWCALADFVVLKTS